MIKIFQAYVNNDYEASGDRGYITDALFAVADEYEIRSVGLGEYLDDEDTTDDKWDDL